MFHAPLIAPCKIGRVGLSAARIVVVVSRVVREPLMWRHSTVARSVPLMLRNACATPVVVMLIASLPSGGAGRPAQSRANGGQRPSQVRRSGQEGFKWLQRAMANALSLSLGSAINIRCATTSFAQKTSRALLT